MLPSIANRLISAWLLSQDHLKDGIPTSVKEGTACHSRKQSEGKGAEVWQRDGEFLSFLNTL